MHGKHVIKKPFFDNWPKTHFLRDWKRRFPIGIFSITFSDSPDLLKTGSFLMNPGYQKLVIEKSFETSSPQLQTHCSRAVVQTVHTVAWPPPQLLLLLVLVGSQCVTSLSFPASSVVAFHPTRTAQGRVDDQCLQSVCASSVFSNTRYMLYRLSVLPHLVETGTY